MDVKERNISELIPAEYNPRDLTEKEKTDLRGSLTRFGIVDPVIVNTHKDRNNIIIGGHQRCKVWESMGNKTIPCVELSLTPEKEKELNVRLNKNTGHWNDKMLSEYFDTESLIEWGFDAGEFIRDYVEGIQKGDELDIPQSLAVIPKMEYIIVVAQGDSLEWERIKDLLKCKRVRSGGCKVGSTSDKVGMGIERVFDFKTFCERLNIKQ